MADQQHTQPEEDFFDFLAQDKNPVITVSNGNGHHPRLNISDIALDPERAEQGVWKEWEGFRFLIGYYNTKEHRKLINEGVRRIRKVFHVDDINDARVPEQIREDFENRMTAKCLLDWDGDIYLGEEKLDGCTMANKLKFFLAAPNFRDWVRSQSYTEENFRRQALEQTAKNSEPGSAIVPQ